MEMEMVNNFLSKKILITGAGGFIGSHLVEELVRLGVSVKALVQYNRENSWGNLEDLPDEIKEHVDVVLGDIRDPHVCKQVTKDIDIVFHLAALIGIPYSYVSPQSYLDTNVAGTVHICQAALENNCARVIHTSTSEVYGTARYVPIDEAHPLQPQSPYSASKIGADAMAMSFYTSFNLPVIIARPFNTFGPRQSLRAVIPTIIMQLLHGAERVQLGSLHPARDFNYVKDVCSGLIAIAESDNVIGETLHIAQNDEISIGNLAQKIIDIINPRAAIVCDEQRVRPVKSEVERLRGANDKIYRLTHWKPAYDLNTGLHETIAWFEQFLSKRNYKTEAYNI